MVTQRLMSPRFDRVSEIGRFYSKIELIQKPVGRQGAILQSDLPDHQKIFRAAAGLSGARPPVLHPSPLVPDHCDYLSVFSGRWKTHGNLDFNNCVPVALAHHLRITTKHLSEVVDVTTAAVLELYKAHNPRFNPLSTGSVVEGDGGINLARMVGDEYSKGNIAAYGMVQAPSRVQMEQLIYNFGALVIGFRTAPSVSDDWKYRGHFRAMTSGELSMNGGNHMHDRHAVVAAGYDDRGVRVVSWGREGIIDWGCFAQGQVCEAYAILWDEHLGLRSFAPGVCGTQLTYELHRLTNYQMPPRPFVDEQGVAIPGKRSREMARDWIAVSEAFDHGSQARVPRVHDYVPPTCLPRPHIVKFVEDGILVQCTYLWERNDLYMIRARRKAASVELCRLRSVADEIPLAIHPIPTPTAVWNQYECRIFGGCLFALHIHPNTVKILRFSPGDGFRAPAIFDTKIPGLSAGHERHPLFHGPGSPQRRWGICGRGDVWFQNGLKEPIFVLNADTWYRRCHVVWHGPDSRTVASTAARPPLSQAEQDARILL